MEKYQIIPRKFRPKRFSEVAGHEAIVTTIKNALKQQRVGQAYLFGGGRGCGKTTLARLFAKALNCKQLTENAEPCNQCESCKEVGEGRSLDVIEIDGASNRGVDDIRQLNETVGYAPSKGRYKIYIIDEVHMLTKEAFNALLKTLEEPPQNVKFFFATTEPHKVPQTIISRCQRFALSRIGEKVLVDKLSRIVGELGVEAEEKALVQIGKLSEGSLRDAESLLDQLICHGKTPITLDVTREVFGLIANTSLDDLDEAILNQDLAKAGHIAQNLYKAGKDLGATIDGLLDHFHAHLHHPKVLSKSQCLAILDTLIEWQQNMLKVPFKPVHLEMLFLTLVRRAHKLSLDKLIERLLELEERLSQEPEETPPVFSPSAQKREEPTVLQQPEPEKPALIVEKTEEKPLTINKEENKKEDLPLAAHPSKYDTVIRFAAVELEGSVERS